MYTSAQQPTEKNYLTTYWVCSGMLAILAIINIFLSVQNMYSTSTSQEFSFKKQQLSEEILRLEKQKTQASNLPTLQAAASAQGFQEISTITYLQSPSSNAVAQR